MVRKFVIKLIVFTAPLWLILLSYVIYDPFKVLYHYDSFYKDYFVNINRDYASSQLFLQNHERYAYNSFIFGSSRTMAFRTKDWESHLDSSSRPFVFDASSEKLSGIWSKIKFLDQEDAAISNVLIVICGDHTFSSQEPNDGPLFIRHPRLNGRWNWIKFHYTFVSAYLNDYFFIRYLDYRWFKKKRNYMYKNIEFIDVRVDPISNDLYRADLDSLLNADEVNYYSDRDSLFYTRIDSLVYQNPQIDDDEKTVLIDIKKIFDRRKTNYQLVVGPLYDQKKLSPVDLQILQSIFGAEHVHDYSGRNDLTQNKLNYYETSHYRPSVGKKIMESIYYNK